MTQLLESSYIKTGQKSKFRELEMPEDKTGATFRFKRIFETRLPLRSDWERGRRDGLHG